MKTILYLCQTMTMTTFSVTHLRHLLLRPVTDALPIELQSDAVIGLDPHLPDPGHAVIARRRRRLIRHLMFDVQYDNRVPIKFEILNRVHNALTSHYETHAETAKAHSPRLHWALNVLFNPRSTTLFAPYIARIGDIQNVCKYLTYDHLHLSIKHYLTSSYADQSDALWHPYLYEATDYLFY